jgi:hypothetical protein
MGCKSTCLPNSKKQGAMVGVAVWNHFLSILHLALANCPSPRAWKNLSVGIFMISQKLPTKE